MKLFIVSSALNEGPSYGRLKKILTEAGHEVLEPPDAQHTWGYISANYMLWDPMEYRQNLNSEAVVEHFEEVTHVMHKADACVLMLPASFASHMAAGWFAGQGKPLFIILLQPEDPNLLHLLADKISIGSTELGEALNESAERQLQKVKFLDYCDEDIMDLNVEYVGSRVTLVEDGAWVETYRWVSNNEIKETSNDDLDI